MVNSVAMRHLLLVCATMFLSIGPIWAQAGGQQKFKVTGSVVNASGGEGVRGALVSLQGPVSKSVMTGSDGQFEIDDLIGGSFVIQAKRPGFAPNQFQQVTVGSSTGAIVLKLAPLSRISGRITDREGEPVDGVQIRCMHEQIVNGRKQWQMVNGANTDESGQFLIEDLAAGTYIIETDPLQLYRVPQRKSEASRYMYPATFYPDGTSRDTAQKIQLAAGEEMKADMELHSIRAAHVTVTTVPSQPGVMGFLSSGDDDMHSGAAQTDGSGELTFGSVAPGSWKIVIQTFSRSGLSDDENALYGQLPVEVGTADITGLKVQLGKLVDIPVVVSGVAEPQVFVQLFSKTGPMQGGSPDQNGAIKISSVAPGTYRVVARPGGNMCVTSLMSGAQDLFRDQLVLSPGSSVSPIQVVESSSCASLSVTTNTKGTGVVLVTSALPGFEPLQIFGGSASALPLSPGEYHVFAFDDISDLEYANPEAMRDFKSETVTLEASEKKSVQVEVNERHTR